MIIVASGPPPQSHMPVSRTLRAMFRDRKTVFVDLLGWEVPVLNDEFEVDTFDDEHAIYVIVADAAGDHLGSARLLPTTRPHILGSLFGGLCAGELPTGANIFEITRFCLSPRQNAAARRQTRDCLVTALVSHALETGIHTFTGVAEVAWLQQILAFGWDCRPLGAPARFDCAMIGALSISIDASTPTRLAENGIWRLTDDAAPLVAKAA